MQKIELGMQHMGVEMVISTTGQKSEQDSFRLETRRTETTGEKCTRD